MGLEVSPLPRLPPAHRAEGPPAPVASLALGGDAPTHKALRLVLQPSGCHCTCRVGVRRYFLSLSKERGGVF